MKKYIPCILQVILLFVYFVCVLNTGTQGESTKSLVYPESYQIIDKQFIDDKYLIVVENKFTKQQFLIYNNQYPIQIK